MWGSTIERQTGKYLRMGAGEGKTRREYLWESLQIEKRKREVFGSNAPFFSSTFNLGVGRGNRAWK